MENKHSKSKSKPLKEVSFYQPPNILNEGYCKSKPKYVESKKTCHSQPSLLEKSFSHRSEYDRIAIQEYNKHALSMDYTPYFTKDDPISVENQEVDVAEFFWGTRWVRNFGRNTKNMAKKSVTAGYNFDKRQVKDVFG